MFKDEDGDRWGQGAEHVPRVRGQPLPGRLITPPRIPVVPLFLHMAAHSNIIWLQTDCKKMDTKGNGST